MEVLDLLSISNKSGNKKLMTPKVVFLLVPHIYPPSGTMSRLAFELCEESCRYPIHHATNNRASLLRRTANFGD